MALKMSGLLSKEECGTWVVSVGQLGITIRSSTAYNSIRILQEQIHLKIPGPKCSISIDDGGLIYIQIDYPDKSD
jgi:hypothetical protein